MTDFNDPYYLGNRDCKPTTITFKTEQRVIEQELPWDVGADEVIHAVYTAMIGMTFPRDGVLQAMKEFVEEQTGVELIEQTEEEQ